MVQNSDAVDIVKAVPDREMIDVRLDDMNIRQVTGICVCRFYRIRNIGANDICAPKNTRKCRMSPLTTSSVQN